jgi:ketosteroid isomerase-like protein
MWTRSTSESKPARHRPAKSLLAAFGACAAILAANPADGRPPDAPEPERLERRLVEAIAKGDLDTYRRIVAEDYVVYDSSGKDITRAEVIASYESGSRHYTKLEIFDVGSRVFGDTAIVSARTKGLRREGDRDVPNRVRYIRVYARRNGEWKAVAQMATPAAEAPAER